MMKTCPGCGNPVPEEATFCPHCGKPLEGQTDGPRYQSAPGASPPASGGESPAIRTLRQLFCSPLYLTVAIGYTVTLVSNLLSLLLTGTGLMSEDTAWVTGLTGATGWTGDVGGAMNTAVWSSLVWSVIAQIPAILVVVSLWMMYASARDRSGAPLKTAGLTIIRVIQIIVLVLVGIMMVLMLGLMGIALTTVGFGDNSEVFTPLVAMMLFILVVVVVLVMLYGVQFIRTVDSIRKTIWTGTLQGNISAYVAVCSILGGIVMVLNILLGLLARAPFTALSGVSGAVSGICFGILLFRCRDEWQRLKAEQTLTESTVR